MLPGLEGSTFFIPTPIKGIGWSGANSTILNIMNDGTDKDIVSICGKLKNIIILNQDINNIYIKLCFNIKYI